MKILRTPTVVSLSLTLCAVLAMPAWGDKRPATDAQKFGRCKHAAQAEFGEAARVKLLRLQRSRAAFSAKISIFHESVNAGERFMATCRVDKAGELSLEPSFALD